jgi:mRNA-degrading endonuclease YafQ of YafQ-DinJ toxin-antitoxin module
MSFRLIYTPGYNRRAARFLKKNPELLAQYETTLKLLAINPFHPSLRLHRLQGSLSELLSASISIGYRITLELLIQEQQVVPIDVGAHDEVYRG